MKIDEIKKLVSKHDNIKFWINKTSALISAIEHHDNISISVRVQSEDLISSPFNVSREEIKQLVLKQLKKYKIDLENQLEELTKQIES